MAFNAKEAFVIARKFGRDYEKNFMMKAQVKPHARSKGYFIENNFKSGIHKVATIDEVRDIAEKMCGNHFRNQYTPESGIQCNSVLIMEEVEVKD